MKKILLHIIIAGFALSCTKETSPGERISDEIVFSVGNGSKYEITTRASAVTSLSEINWLCTSTASTATQVYAIDNLSVSGGTVCTGVFWPSVSTTYTMYASNEKMTFTKGSSGEGSVTLKPSSNARDVVVGKKADVAWKTRGTIVLDHIYARLTDVVITAPEGYVLSGVTLSMSAPVSGTYNVNSAAWTPGTAAAQTFGSASYDNVSAEGNKATLKQDLYIVPGTYTLTCKYTLTRGKYSETFTKTAGIPLVMGKKTSITSTLPAGNAVGIEFSVGISGWGDTALTPVFS